MMIQIWEEFEEEITCYQLSFAITVITGLMTIYVLESYRLV